MFTRMKVWNGAFWIGLTISILLQVVAILGPLQGLLHIHPVAFGDIAIVSAIAFAIAIIPVEIHKYFGRRFMKKSDQ